MKFGQSWLFQILCLNLQCIDFHGFCTNYCYILNCSKHEYCEIAAIGKNAKILIALISTPLVFSHPMKNKCKIKHERSRNCKIS